MNPLKQSLHDDPKLSRYFRKRNHKPKTRQLITDRFYYYYKATGLTPTTMISQADMEEEQGIRLRRRKIITHLDTFEEYLEDRYSENTIRQSITTIRSFYHFNHIELPPPDRKPRKNDIVLTVDDLPGLLDIRRALSESGVRDNAIIILMASSGMGKAEIMSLTWQHLITAIGKYEKVTVDTLFSIAQTRPEWTETIGPLTWKVRRVKTGLEYTTFSSNESFDNLLDYLRSRPQVMTNPSDPLFITNRKQGFNQDNFDDVFVRINRRCGFGTAKDGLNYFRSHNLRKWFANQLNRVMSSDDVQKLLGHTEPNKTKDAYLKTNLKTLYDLYYENMGVVTVTRDVEVHKPSQEKLNELEAMVLEMQKELLEKDKGKR